MAHELRIPNALALDFTPPTAGGTDNFLSVGSNGLVGQFTSIPVSRLSGGGNLTESTSSVLTITGGTGALLGAASIQVKLATNSQSGYLSAADWSTFNGKLGTSLTSANIFVGNGSNVATGVSVTGAVSLTNAGVSSINANYIVDSMVNSSAAIAVTKLAALTTSLMVATNGSGFLTTVAGFTPTIAGYLTNITSDVQAQLNGKLSVTLTSPSSGDVITYNGSAWVNSPTGSGTLPTGGTANQFLTKINSTNYNTQWHTLVAADVSDVTSTAAELNVLHTVTTTTAQFNYLNTATSDVQAQLNNKQSSTLPHNALWLGNVSNLAGVLAAGSNGQVLQIAAGVPTWQTITGTGTVTSVDFSSTDFTVSGNPITTSGTIVANLTTTGVSAASYTAANLTVDSKGRITAASNGFSNAAASNEIMKSDGTNAVPSGAFSTTLGNLNLGGPSTTGTTRTLTVDGSGTNINLALLSKGTGNISLSTSNSGGFIATSSHDVASGSDAFVTLNYNGSAYNNTVNYVRISNQSTGTVANGIGTGILFHTTTGSGNFAIGGSLEALSTSITLGSESYDLVFRNMDSGTLTETFRFSSFGGLKINGSYGTAGQVPVSGGPSGSLAWGPSAGTLTNALSVDNASLQFNSGTTFDGSAAKTISVKTAGITNAMLANSSITLNTGSNFGITVPGTMSLGSTYTIGSTSDNLRFSDLGLGVASPTNGGQISTVLGANNITALQVKRNTDASPTGNFIDFQNAASTSLFKIDITGAIITGSYTATKIGLAYGGTNTDLSATGGTSQYLKQISSGANITVGTIPASDIASGQALTKTDDTNVILTLGGTPSTALLQAASLTLGWTGTLAYSRFVNGGGLSVTGRSANSSGVQADITGTANQVLRVNGAGTTLGFGSLDLTQSVGASILPLANGGTNNSSFTNGSVIFYNSTGTKFDQDNNNLFWNSGSHILSVNTGGDQTGTDAINAYNQIDAYLPNSSQGAITSSGGTSGFTASSSRGTGASPSNLNANDLVGGFSMWGYTNSAYTNVAGAFGYVTGSTSTNLGGEYRIYTKADGGALTQRFTVDNAGGLQAVSANFASNWSGSATATANNQSFLSFTQAITSRGTASDNINAINLGGSITAASTSIVGDPLLINTVFKTSSGITASSAGTQTGAVFVSRTTAGMTVNTYTNVAPASTSGSGTGALFTVVVATATTFTSITCTTSGSGYSVGETLTFNGSQFGSGSGSITIGILSTLNSFGANAAQLVIRNPYGDFAGITAPMINFTSADGSTSLGGVQIGAVSSGNATLQINDAVGSMLSSNGATLSTARTFQTLGSLSVTGGMTLSSALTDSYTYFNSNGNTGAIIFTGSTSIGGSGLVRAPILATGGIITGVPATYSVQTAGSGYTAGNKSTTGGTGSGANVTITVSSGAIATAVPLAGSNAGTGYVVNDVLNVSGGTSGQVKVLTVDQFGGVASLAADTRSLTDATSNNNYISYYAKPTFVLTGSTASTFFLYGDATYTSFGTGTKGGIAIIPSGTLSTIGGSTFDATLKLIGSGSNPTFKTVGVSNSTNYSIQCFQSNGSTQIFGLQDNGTATLTGDFKLSAAGNGFYVKEGSNATMGTGTLSGGTLVVNTTKVTANSRIFLSDQGGTVTNLGTLYVSARSAGTSFTVSSSNVLDASNFCWIIFEPS